ncbi:hypothetical protein AVEN_245240-1 [Araneus ventricosus]|uniref:Uncharacterized protein n=1 Tax=Araneus ventricosus TaxID=182803 RepID=A0A4Y2GQK4_ARAVE|nr:hypothetical protein AVEN_245240-1 [Araneus ventricosus]
MNKQQCDVSEPPLTRHLPEEVLRAFIEEISYLLALIWDCFCHTEAVKRYAKTVTEASGKIERILKSSPLIPLSSDLNEYEVWTPVHFLIGRPITAIPKIEVINISDNKLSRWQQLTKLIWKN